MDVVIDDIQFETFKDLQKENTELKREMKDRLQKSIIIIKELDSTKVELTNTSILFRNIENKFDILSKNYVDLEKKLENYKKYVENLPESLRDYQHESGNNSVDIEKFIEVQKQHFLKGE